MAYLLGGEYCIDSLRQDVKDLEDTLCEVHSRVGQVKYQSWKFPDKASCDINIAEILERCQFNTDDDEECQMSHVMLYDVVIDRLVFLLQSFICYNEILLDVGSRNTSKISPEKSRTTLNKMRSMSIGLTTKKCWGRMSQVATLLQRLAKEVNHTLNKADDIKEDKSPDIASDVQHSPEKGVTFNDVNEKILERKDISCDVRSVSCQTSETSYSTCETCCRAQGCLNSVGKTIIELCKAQGLPTALEDYLSRFQSDVPMSIADLARWSNHQTKDLSRISRHMTSLVNQVAPLKTDLAVAKKTEADLIAKLQRSDSVFERKEAELRDEIRRREYRLKEVEKDLKKKISVLERSKAELEENSSSNQWKISELKDELLQRHRENMALETKMALHKEEALEGQQYKKDALRFKKDLANVKNDLEKTCEQLHAVQQQLNMEITRNKNLERHEQVLQEKQKSLLKRMEALNDNCEKMNDQIIQLEEERDSSVSMVEEMKQISKTIDHTTEYNKELANIQTEEIDTLKKTLDSLRKENEMLQSCVSDYVERERLLVSYPDLNINNQPSPMVQGSGDVISDMRKQVEANEVRITVLQKENSALAETLHKWEISNLENSSQHSSQHASDESGYDHQSPDSPISFNKPIPLWKNSELLFKKAGHDDSAAPQANSPDTELSYGSYREWHNMQKHGHISKPRKAQQKWSVPNRTHKTRDIPEQNGIHVGGSESSAYSSSALQAYKNIKRQQEKLEIGQGSVRRSFTVGSGRRPTSGRPASAKSALLKPWT